jgi:MazG nucleotide pyrophosphohydrolase domain.
MDLTDLQTALGQWADIAIGADTTYEQHGLKVCEEAGELARAIGCRSTGARGTRAYWDMEIQREAADVVLAVAFMAHRIGFDLGDALVTRFGELRARDAVGVRPAGDEGT